MSRATNIKRLNPSRYIMYIPLRIYTIHNSSQLFCLSLINLVERSNIVMFIYITKNLIKNIIILTKLIRILRRIYPLSLKIRIKGSLSKRVSLLTKLKCSRNYLRTKVKSYRNRYSNNQLSNKR